jgi:hypothetical protein
MIASLLGFVLFTLIVSTWSHRRGTGFWFAFFWSVLLSPIIGALFAYLRRPRGHVLVLGGIEAPIDPSAPRPMFCAIMIVAIVLAIVVCAGGA